MLRESRYLVMDPPEIVLFIFFGLLSLYSTNTLLSVFSFAVLASLALTLWRQNEPPILFFVLFFQWIQICTRIYQANNDSKMVNDYVGSLMAETAITYSLIGIFVNAMGHRYYLNKLKMYFKKEYIVQQAAKINIHKTFVFYIYVFLGTGALGGVAYIFPGLTQIFIHFINVKWIIYCTLVYVVLNQRAGYIYLAAAFSIELVSGALQFFSAYKDVFILTGLVFITTNYKVNLKSMVIMVPMVYILFNITIAWTALKQDYRGFLSNSETKNSSVSQKIDYLQTLYQDYQSGVYGNSLNKTLDRLSYTDMFSYVLESVPSIIPHEDGKIFMGYIEHLIKPRLFFPQKARIDDSELANKYTNRKWTGSEVGTSISIGYYAELFVDFGFPGMLLPILLLGVAFGRIYNYIMEKHKEFNLIIIFSCTIAFFNWYKFFETAGIKILLPLVLSLLVYQFIVFKYFLPFAQRFILNESAK